MTSDISEQKTEIVYYDNYNWLKGETVTLNGPSIVTVQGAFPRVVRVKGKDLSRGEIEI